MTGSGAGSGRGCGAGRHQARPSLGQGLLAGALWLLAVPGIAALAWVDHLLRQAGRPDLVQLDASGAPFLVAVLTAANPFALPAPAGPLLVVRAAGSLLVSASVMVAAVSLFVRARRASGVERLQLGWVTLAAVLVGLLSVLLTVAAALAWELVLTWALGVVLAVLPLALGAAVARYRLYDVDRLVNRTVVYGLVSVILGAGYALVVLGLGQLAGRRGSNLAVAGATLAVAALFQPLRRRVQAAVDRRFDRRKVDAAATIAAFGVRLREQLDLATVGAELEAAVERTMQPTTVSLWLRAR